MADSTVEVSSTSPEVEFRKIFELTCSQLEGVIVKRGWFHLAFNSEEFEFLGGEYEEDFVDIHFRKFHEKTELPFTSEDFCIQSLTPEVNDNTTSTTITTQQDIVEKSRVIQATFFLSNGTITVTLPDTEVTTTQQHYKYTNAGLEKFKLDRYELDGQTRLFFTSASEIHRMSYTVGFDLVMIKAEIALGEVVTIRLSRRMLTEEELLSFSQN